MSDNPPPPPTWKARFLAYVSFGLGIVTLVARAARRCFFGVLAFAISMAFFMLAPQGKGNPVAGGRGRRLEPGSGRRG
jgi:hypothetical protein